MTETGAMIASMVSSVAAGGVSAYASIKQGQAAKAEADYNARVAERNAMQDKLVADSNVQTAEANKREVLYQANLQREQLAKRLYAGKASETTKLAARGLSLSGSSEDLLLSDMADFEEQQALTLYKGATEGLGYERQKNTFTLQGDNALTVGSMAASGMRASGSNALRAGYLGAASAIASGTSRAAETYYSSKK